MYNINQYYHTFVILMLSYFKHYIIQTILKGMRLEYYLFMVV